MALFQSKEQGQMLKHHLGHLCTCLQRDLKHYQHFCTRHLHTLSLSNYCLYYIYILSLTLQIHIYQNCCTTCYSHLSVGQYRFNRLVQFIICYYMYIICYMYICQYYMYRLLYVLAYCIVYLSCIFSKVIICYYM